MDGARRVLRDSLQGVEPAPTVEEWDVTDGNTPAHLRGWGSPTVLVDGADVVGGDPEGVCCRVYSGSQDRGTPPRQAILAALRRG